MAIGIKDRAAQARGKYDQTRAHFRQALAIRRELGLSYYIAEDLAELAWIALVQGDTTEAQARVEEVLPILESNPALDGVTHPNRAILTCYRVLRACGDTRATDILADAHARLQERADRIAASEAGAEALRRAFLEDVPENREIVASWEALQAE